MTPELRAAVDGLRTLFANKSPVANVLAVALNPQGLAFLKTVLDAIDPPVVTAPKKPPGIGVRCTGTLTALKT